MYIPKYFKVTNIDGIEGCSKKTLLEQSSQPKRETNRNSFTLLG